MQILVEERRSAANYQLFYREIIKRIRKIGRRGKAVYHGGVHVDWLRELEAIDSQRTE